MPLLTIGYEGTEVADFVSVLRHVGVRHLVDIRDFPSSRKAGFSKTPLQQHLANSGIAYSHVKALGDPREGRVAARNGEIATFRKIFTSHINTSVAHDALREIARESIDTAVCLMCFERDHLQCHRTIVCEEILKLTAVQVKHIGVPKGFSQKAA